jgi:hypothetical protein
MRPARLALVAVVVAAGPMLSACESANSLISAMENFEIWDSKKKLPGDRKPVFPEGVPGVATGVPPEMVRGYREPEQGPLDPAKAAAEAAAADQSKPKPKTPQRTASKPPPKPQAPPDPYAQAAPARSAAPAPAAAQPPPQAAAPWPAQPPAAQPQAAWPGSAPGTVAR